MAMGEAREWDSARVREWEPDQAMARGQAVDLGEEVDGYASRLLYAFMPRHSSDPLVTSDDLRNDLVSLDSVLAVFQRLIAEGEVFDSFLTDRCATLIRIQLSSTSAYRTRSRYYVLIRPTDAERSTVDLVDLCAQIFLRSNIVETFDAGSHTTPSRVCLSIQRGFQTCTVKDHVDSCRDTDHDHDGSGHGVRGPAGEQPDRFSLSREHL